MSRPGPDTLRPALECHSPCPSHHARVARPHRGPRLRLISPRRTRRPPPAPTSSNRCCEIISGRPPGLRFRQLFSQNYPLNAIRRACHFAFRPAAVQGPGPPQALALFARPSHCAPRRAPLGRHRRIFLGARGKQGGPGLVPGKAQRAVGRYIRALPPDRGAQRSPDTVRPISARTVEWASNFRASRRVISSSTAVACTQSSGSSRVALRVFRLIFRDTRPRSYVRASMAYFRFGPSHPVTWMWLTILQRHAENSCLASSHTHHTPLLVFPVFDRPSTTRVSFSSPAAHIPRFNRRPRRVAPTCITLRPQAANRVT